MTKIKLGVVGATGRMGRQIIKTALEGQDFEIMAAISPSRVFSGNLADGITLNPKVILGNNIKDSLKSSEVIVDFSHRDFTMDLLNVAKDIPKALVIGTTSLNLPCLNLITQVSKVCPIVYSRNTSLGIAAIQSIIPKLVKLLGGDFDIELVETHHRHKRDAPSGTCLMLGEIVAKARNVNLADVAKFSRNDNDILRKQGEIGFSVLRGGGVPGEHTINFIGDNESLQVTHRSFSPRLFAKGALIAAKWVINQPPGLYDMQDVLGIEGYP